MYDIANHGNNVRRQAQRIARAELGPLAGEIDILRRTLELLSVNIEELSFAPDLQRSVEIAMADTVDVLNAAYELQHEAEAAREFLDAMRSQLKESVVAAGHKLDDEAFEALLLRTVEMWGEVNQDLARMPIYRTALKMQRPN